MPANHEHALIAIGAVMILRDHFRKSPVEEEPVEAPSKNAVERYARAFATAFNMGQPSGLLLRLIVTGILVANAPDVDFFWVITSSWIGIKQGFGAHRICFHSILAMIGFGYLGYYSCRSHITVSQRRLVFWLMMFLSFSHGFLDCFNVNGVAWFWPLTSVKYGFGFELFPNMQVQLNKFDLPGNFWAVMWGQAFFSIKAWLLGEILALIVLFRIRTGFNLRYVPVFSKRF